MISESCRDEGNQILRDTIQKALASKGLDSVAAAKSSGFSDDELRAIEKHPILISPLMLVQFMTALDATEELADALNRVTAVFLRDYVARTKARKAKLNLHQQTMFQKMDLLDEPCSPEIH